MNKIYKNAIYHKLSKSSNYWTLTRCSFQEQSKILSGLAESTMPNLVVVRVPFQVSLQPCSGQGPLPGHPPDL